MKRTLMAAALLALAGSARAESWAMHCHNTAGTPDYDASWQSETGALMIIAAGKPTQRYVNVWNADQGWAGTKALATVHFDNGAQLEAYFERNLAPDMAEGGPHMAYRDALGNVLTLDPCVVTKYW
jgi:acyl-coenzyme A synthetase/AMP-(fatty) acid ligase